MKNFKQSLALILSTAICVSSALTFSVNAVDYGNINSSAERYEEFMQGLTKIDDHGLWERWGYFGSIWEEKEFQPYAVYATPNGKSYWHIRQWGAELVLETPADITDEAVTGILHKYISKYTYGRGNSETEGLSLWNVYVNYFNDISQNEYRELVAELKENGYLISFIYSDYLSPIEIECPDLKSYELSDYDALVECVKENELDCTVVNDNGVYVVPNTELTLDEQFALAALIKEKTGCSPYAFAYESEESALSSSSIDMFGATDGDSNEDGELNMADAVFIMQSIANPDKYALTAQGRFNADISNTGDGITVKDALAIQKRLLGIDE